MKTFVLPRLFVRPRPVSPGLPAPSRANRPAPSSPASHGRSLGALGVALAIGCSVFADTDITVGGASDLPPTAGSLVGGIFSGLLSPTSTIYLGHGENDSFDTLLKQLAAGNVSVTTSSGGSQPGDITFNDAVNIAVSSNLTFTAGNNISVNQSISNSGGGAIALNATGLLALSGSGDVGLSTAPVAFSAPSLTLNKLSGDVYLSAASGGTNVSGSTAGALALSTAGGNIAQSASTALVIGGKTTLNAPTFDVTLDQAGNDFSAVAITDARNATLVDANAISLTTSTLTGGLSVTATDIALSGAVSTRDSQSYSGKVTLAADASLESTEGGISLPSITDGNNHVLSLSTAGNDSLGTTHNLQSLVKAGTGTLRLTGENDYTGGTTVTDGTLEVSSTGTLASSGDVILENSSTFSVQNDLTIRGLIGSDSASNVDIDAGRMLTLNLPDGGYVSYSGSISGAGSITLTKTGPGTFIFTGDAHASPVPNVASHEGFGQNLVWPQGSGLPGHFQLNVNSGTFQLGDSEQAGSLDADVFIDSPAVFNYVTPSASEATLFLEGGGKFKKYGEATLTLPNPSTFSGTIQIAEGTLAIADADAVGSATIDFNGGTLQTTASIDPLSNAITIQPNTNATVDTSSDTVLTYNGNLTGATNSALYKAGGGTLSLQSAVGAVAPGKLEITNGTVAIDSLNALNHATDLAVDGGTLFAVNENQTIRELAGDGVVSIAEERQLTVNGSFGSTTYEGSLTGDGALRKAGFNALTLDSANNYAGGTIINGGTLVAGVAGALPTGKPITVEATSGTAALYLDDTTQTVGAISLGGPDAASFSTNNIVLGLNGSLTLQGTAGVTYDASNDPNMATIGAMSPFSQLDPRGGTLVLGAGEHTFVIADSGNAEAELTIYSNITDSGGSGSIAKSGPGTLLLAGTANSFTGGVTVNQGRLLVASDEAAGSGTLTVQNGATLAGSSAFSSAFDTDDDPVILSNPVSLADGATLGLADKYGKQLGLIGQVTLPNGIVNLGGDEVTWLAGTIDSSGNAVSFYSANRSEVGKVILAGATVGNLATGNPSITAHQTALLIANADALTPTYHAVSGYIGVAQTPLDVTVPTASALLAKIDPDGFSGTFGFDTDLDHTHAPHSFSVQGMDFSAFSSGSITLGSITAARITGTFTPPIGGYVFGNGGGKLFVASDLGGNYPVAVSSVTDFEDNALTVVFQGNNTYSGNLTIANSAVILDSEHALPTGSAVQLNSDSYFGHTENYADSFTTFFSRVAPEGTPISYSPDAILGIDSANYLAKELDSHFDGNTTRVIDSPIDLSGFGPIYLGTATDVVLSGTISAPNQVSANKTLKLAAIDEGTLTINSALTSDKVSQVVVGLESNVLKPGTVVLAGNNTYTGGTTLNSGSLYIANSSYSHNETVVGPLGSGALTVAAAVVEPVLAADTGEYGYASLSNDIVLNGPLQLGTTSYDGSYNYQYLSFYGNISGSGRLDVFNNTYFNGSNCFTGGVSLFNGQLGIGSDTALGSGTLEIRPTFFNSESATVGLSVSGSHTLTNDVNLALGDSQYLPIYGDDLTLAGHVTLSTNATLQLSDQNSLTIVGDVSGNGRLAVAGGKVILSGTNTYGGGTEADGGAAVFDDIGSIPSNGSLIAGFGGYIGLARPPEGTLQNNFINRFSRGSTTGTIGFDTPRGAETTSTFTDAIDLTGFNNNVRLGSASSAILAESSTITPAASEYYRFGGGGGLLEVNSSLDNGNTTGRAVDVSSSSNYPLTLRLGGTNSYSGDTSVWYSALIFKSGAISTAEHHGSFAIDSGGYIGTEDNSFATSPASFIGQFSSVNGIIGFDSFAGTYTIDHKTIDVSEVPSNDADNVYLGTATSATFAAGATIAPAANTYRFAGYKGGHLTVASSLSDNGQTFRSVVIGDPDSPATSDSPVEPHKGPSTVTLNGDNSYTGGTTLYAGKLVVGQSNGTIGTNATTALGTGKLTVDEANFSSDHEKTLSPDADGVVVANDIQLDDDLSVDVASAMAFKLSGAISAAIGSVELYKTGSGTLYLSGNNSVNHANTYVSEGNVTFETAASVGLGWLGLGYSPTASATFLQSSTVYGIYGDNTDQSITFVANLAVDQQFDSYFYGHLNGSGTLTLQNSGTYPAKLYLAGASPALSSDIHIENNLILVVANANALGTYNNITIASGGTLAIGETDSPIQLSANTVRGIGTVSIAGSQKIDGGFTLAPGLGNNAIGELHFESSLEGAPARVQFSSGGIYEWDLQNSSGEPGSGFDSITIDGTLAFNFDSNSPFTFRLRTLGSDGSVGPLSGFDKDADHEWRIVTTSGAIMGLDPAKITFDVSGFQNDSIPASHFNVGLSNDQTGLLLKFSAVPEPSTWALLIAGLGMIGFATLRRKHGRRNS